MNRRIRDVLATKGRIIHGVLPSSVVSDAAKSMRRHGIGSVLVRDDSKVYGILDERDVLVRVVAAGRDPTRTFVAEVMRTEVATLHSDASLRDGLRLMTERRARHIPVLDGDRLLGLVSIGDLTKAMTEELELEVRDLTAYIGGPFGC